MAADGYSRMNDRRKFGVMVSQGGPGSENSMGGIAQAFGVAPVDISQTLAGRSTGRIVGQYRGDVDPMPIRIVSPEGMDFDPVALATATVHGDRGANVPLMQVATPHLALAPASIRHYDQRPVAHVYTELTENAVYSQVLAPLQRAIAAADLPPGTTIGAIARGDDVLIAHHDTVIESGDHVMLFIIEKKHTADVEKLFQVGVSYV